MDVLIGRFLSGEASEQESEALFSWLDEDDANLALFEQVRSVWNAGVTNFSADEIDVKAALRAVNRRIELEEKAGKPRGGGGVGRSIC